jgi:predicted ribosomally synthesized peptide with nif11-like leader
MSVESATKFIHKVMDDKSFAEMVRSATTAEEKFQIARDAGFDFTRKEFEEAKSAIPLTDEELDGLSGGLDDRFDPRYNTRIEPCDAPLCTC